MDDEDISIDWKRLEEEECAAKAAEDRRLTHNYRVGRFKNFVGSVVGFLIWTAVFIAVLFVLVRLIRAFWYM